MMSKPLLCGMIFLAFFITSCKNSKSPSDSIPTDTEVVVATGTVDATGGTIAGGDISITIPQGSVTSSSVIKIIETQTTPAGANQISKTYSLDGLPQDYKGNLDVKIKYSKPLAKNSFVAAYHFTSSRSVASSVYAFNLFTPRDSAGLLLATLDFGAGRPSLPRGGAIYVAQTGRIELTAVTGIDTLLKQTAVPNMIFANYYDPNSVPLSYVVKVTDAFAKCGMRYQDLGFSYAARTTSSPFPIYYTNDPNADDYAFYSRGFPWTLNGAYIQINYAKVQSDEEINASVAHEFFHFIHDCYGMTDDATWWYQDALCTFAEELLQADPASYYSPQYATFYNRPFLGLEAGKEWYDPVDKVVSYQRHGYGNGALIRELYYNSVSKKPTTLLNLVRSITVDHLTPIEALRREFTDFDGVWANYFDRYFLGKLPFITASTIREEAGLDPGGKRTWKIITASDTLVSYAEEMFDLSVNVYRIHLNRDFTDYENLMIIAGAVSDKSDLEVCVYKYKNAGMKPAPELITHSPAGTDTTYVTGLKTIKTDYTSLIVVIINHRAVKPFDGKKQVNVAFKVDKNELLGRLKQANGVDVIVKGIHNASNSSGGGIVIYYTSADASPYPKLNWTSPVSFTSVHTPAPPSGYCVRRAQNLSATLSSDGKRINSLNAKDVLTTYYSDGRISEVKNTEITLTNIPFSSDGLPGSSIANYGVTGQIASSYVAGLVYKYQTVSYATGTPVYTTIAEYQSTNWTADSFINIMFRIN